MSLLLNHLHLSSSKVIHHWTLGMYSTMDLSRLAHYFARRPASNTAAPPQIAATPLRVVQPDNFEGPFQKKTCGCVHCVYTLIARVY